MRYYTKSYKMLKLDDVHRYEFEILLSKEFLIFCFMVYYNQAK